MWWKSADAAARSVRALFPGCLVCRNTATRRHNLASKTAIRAGTMSFKEAGENELFCRQNFAQNNLHHWLTLTFAVARRFMLSLQTNKEQL
jgi:hypothetical protein